MDADVARWILEYLLRQSLEDRTLNALIRVLPFPNDNSSLKKAMVLRRIESEIAKGSIPEEVLGFLERIEELDYEEGIACSDAMKWAYCAVAVDCTLRFLDEGEENKGEYFDAVMRIWRGRVWKMERSDKAVGLVSDELKGWRDDIEAAVWDPSVCENLRVKNRGHNVLEAVMAYVHEAWRSMGPSFLEIVAGTVSNDALREVRGRANSQIGDQVVGDSPHSRVDDQVVGNSPQDLIVSDKDKESQRGGVLPRRKHVAVKRSRGATIGTSRGVKITDTEELEKSSNRYNGLPTHQINTVQEALRTSSLELQAVVEDPLPEALRLAKNVIACMDRENMNQEPLVRHNEVDVDISNPSAGMTSEAALATEANCDNQRSRHQNDVPKPSLMARNSTARTFEWDDSIDSLSDGSADHKNGLHLPTPKGRLVSPLKKYRPTNLSRRRKVRKWSTLEEDTLRTGVEKFGMGCWKLILNSYRDTFEERTEVDLKDKWRNMTRY